MLTSAEVETLFDRILLAVYQAGAVARRLQGQVANEGKDAERMPGDSAGLTLKRAAKSAVDDAAQECLLLAALDVIDASRLALDAEEQTDSVSRFAESADSTLVIDPVDGTLEYLQGLTNYSVCAGLVQGGSLDFAIVHFPRRDLTYYLSTDRNAYLASGHPHLPSAAPRLLSVDPQSTSRVVFKNGRTPTEATVALTNFGYSVVDDTRDGLGCPDAILSVLSGASLAYLSHTRQMRDILLGAVVAAAAGCYATDWVGAPLLWPAGGRVPRAIFGAGAGPPADILQSLRSSAAS